MKKLYEAHDKKLQECIKAVGEYTKGAVKTARYEHSIRVAQTAVLLCKQYAVNTDFGFLAGIAHDMCKDLTAEMLFRLAKQDGFEISALETQKPALLHGRAAAIMLELNFGVQEKSVFEAVRNHTFGYPYMCDLAKIIYIADKIEPGRNYKTAPYYKLIKDVELNELARLVCIQNIDFLCEKGKIISPLSRQFLDTLIT